MAEDETNQQPRKPRSRLRKIAGRSFLALLVLLLVAMLGGVGTFIYFYQTTDLPDPNGEFQTNTTFIYYGDGKSQLGSLAVQNRQSLSYDQIPQRMRDAVVAAENETFWEDPGFSAPGIARSLWSIATGGEVQGGSTITQQYIKILYLDSGRRVSRKLNELILAIKMGRELPKEEILQGYLNTIYFGRGAYGIQAASKSYFLKDVGKLSLEETAVLAAILNNPAGLNPSGNATKRERLLGRYRYVLDRMLATGKITQAEHDRAHPKLPAFPEVPTHDRYGGTKGFLIKMVENELLGAGLSEAQIEGGGLKIVTTLDKKAQDASVKVAQDNSKEAAEKASGSPDPSKLHAAISSVDTSTGGILALYAGPDYIKNSRNWATTPRPAASTFKTFATIAGLREGFTLNSKFNGDTFTPRGDSKSVRNEFGMKYGPAVSLRKATADSINTAFVDLTEQLPDGPQDVIQAAEDAGAPKSRGWDPVPRIALGSAEVSPLNMANAYATLANGGRRNKTHIVAKVTDRKGEVIYEAKPANQQTIDKNVAANVTESLTSVVNEGTGKKAASLGRPVAGKTGTNGVKDSITSAWFVGYTKQVSTAVMYVAGEAGNADLEDYKRPADQTFFGSTYPLRTWVDFMKEIMEGKPEKDFDEAKPIKSERKSDEEEKDEKREASSPSPRPEQSQEASPRPEPTPRQSTSREPEPSADASVAPRPSVPIQPSPVQPSVAEPHPQPSQLVPPTRPTTRPSQKPSTRPTSKPSSSRPSTRPSARPTNTQRGDREGNNRDRGGQAGSGHRQNSSAIDDN